MNSTMKTLIYVCLLSAATIQAQPYSAEWSEFDSGSTSQQADGVSHSGTLTSWLRAPSHGTNYHNQQGYPVLPTVVENSDAPVLSIALQGAHIRLSWPGDAGGFVLQGKATFEGETWTDVAGPYSANSEEHYVLIPADQASHFYRLRLP